MRQAGWLTLLSAFVLALACGDGGNGEDGGGGGGGSNQQLRCMPSEAIVVAPEFETGGLIHRVMLDDEYVFVGGFSEIFAAPRSGGPATRVYSSEKEGRIEFFPAYWPYDGKLLVGVDDEIRVYPRLGGEVEETISLPFPFSTNLDGRADAFIDRDGKTLFAKNDPLVPDGMTPSVTYFSFDLETRNSRTILGNSDIGSRSTLVKGDDYLYTSHVPDKDVGSISAGELYRIPVAGGAPEKLPLELEMAQLNVIGADEAHLYLFGMELPLDAGERPAGLYRLPIEGGTPEKLVVTHAVERNMLVFQDRGDHHVVWASEAAYRIEKGSGEVKTIVRSNCIRGMAADEGAVFLALEPEEGRATIVRVSYE